ncbi:ATP-binding cassette domain-containing protein [Corynebacterium sp. 4HC-13]|uniref:ABC transporter ATP-binding protein n=1 Tax=Corynebacterium anserum TaxID=2684406 RepID=UPI001639F9AF|nr:ABC transporter ATP-binding protein [Corynebacterium anserum]MBC2681992.1 ATP-binding cassette domain-containing protein [Corynebacterium anserum]
MTTPSPQISSTVTQNPTSSELVVEVRGLYKSFGNSKALRGLDLSVYRGSIHGFLGPNGAGKSTTIRTLLGLLSPEKAAGTVVKLLGYSPHNHPEVLRRVGYVPGEVALWPNLTGEETLRALEKLRGVSVDRGKERQLISDFCLDTSRKVREYSTGNRRKVLLVAAFSFNAELYIFDEPTAGLDPLMENVFTQWCCQERDRGASILLSSHIMSEVEKLCDHITVIKEGYAVDTGSVADLRHLSDVVITAVKPSPSSGESSTERVTITVPRDQSAERLRRLLDDGAQDITCNPASLEQIFLHHYELGEPYRESTRDREKSGEVEQ